MQCMQATRMYHHALAGKRLTEDALFSENKWCNSVACVTPAGQSLPHTCGPPFEGSPPSTPVKNGFPPCGSDKSNFGSNAQTPTTQI